MVRKAVATGGTVVHTLVDPDLRRSLIRRHGFAAVDVTNKPIEESATEVIGAVVQGRRRIHT